MQKEPEHGSTVDDEYRQLFDQSPHPMWIVDEESLRFAAANDAAVRRYGYTRPDFADLTADAIWVGRARMFEDLEAGGTLASSSRGSCLHKTSHGDVFQVEVLAHAVRFRGRRAWLVMAMEVAERVSAAHDFDENTRLRALFEYALDPIVLIDDDGRFVDANPAAAALLGRPRNDLKGGDVRAFMPREMVPEGDILHTLRHEGLLTGELTLVRADGTSREVEFRSVADILPGLHLAVIRDVNEMRRANETLRRHAQIIDQIEEAIISTDLEWRVTSWNAGAERLFGYAASQTIERHVSFIFPPDERERVSARIAEAVQGHGAHVLESRLLRQSGHEFFGQIRFSLFRTEAGEPSGTIVSTVNITARKLAEQQLRKSHEELRRLSSYARSFREEERTRLSRELHDHLGQALAGLKLDLSWLGERLTGATALAPEIPEKANVMLNRIDETIQQVRRLAAGLRPGVLDKLGLLAAVEWLAGDFERRSAIRCRLSSTVEQIDLDRGRATGVYRIVEQALTNILTHAKASRVAITVLVSGNWLEISVSDNGKGIPQTAILSTESLGLVGMRERAALLGGSAEIRPDRPSGTVVTVRVPLEDRRHAPRRERS